MFRENIVSPNPTVKRLRQVYLDSLDSSRHELRCNAKALLCEHVVTLPEASPGAVSAVLIVLFQNGRSSSRSVENFGTT